MTDALFLGCVLISGLMVVVGAGFWLARKVGLLEDERWDA